MCGGSYPDASPEPMPKGLSPRVRGKLGLEGQAPEFPGSIPACAGEAVHSANAGDASAVYPRVCGGSALH